MSRICDTCAVCRTKRCPYENGEIPVDLEYGCYRYVKLVLPYNTKKQPSRCAQCRYFFRKSREESHDKSFIVCGAIPSLTQKIEPVPYCPNFKPLRRKQAAKRNKQYYNKGR